MSNVNAASFFANLESAGQMDEKGNSFCNYAPSAEDSFAEKEFTSKLLLRAQKRCSPKHYDIFCSIVFQKAKYRELAEKYGCSVSRIRQYYARSQRIIRLVTWELIENRPTEPPERKQPDKGEKVSRIVEPEFNKTPRHPAALPQRAKEQKAKASVGYESASKPKTEKPKEQTVSAAQGQCPEHVISTSKKYEEAGHVFSFGCLGLIVVLSLFVGGGWYLYDAVTPGTKGMTFERVVIESLAGDTFAGDIQLAVDAHGMPVRIAVTAGTTADCTQAVALIDGIAAQFLWL